MSIRKLSYLLQLLLNFRRPNNKRASYRILHSLYTWIHVVYCHKTFHTHLRTVIGTHIFTASRHCSQKVWPASELSAPVSRLPAAPRNIPRVDNMIKNWCKQQWGGHDDGRTLVAIKYVNSVSHEVTLLPISVPCTLFLVSVFYFCPCFKG